MNINKKKLSVVFDVKRIKYNFLRQVLYIYIGMDVRDKIIAMQLPTRCKY